jgi:uncharacterized protein YndB with AHSA1/START domain
VAVVKKVLIGLAVLVLAFLGFVASRPADFRIERQISVAAPAGTVFPLVADFHRWAEWSPWEKLDPQMKRTLSGSPAGTGAAYHWVGNDQVGEGQMTITEASAASRIVIKLEFLKPFPSTSTTTFTFETAGKDTRVVWTMTGTNDFMGKAFCVFMDMDKMVGGDFERGLGALKRLAEAEAAKAAETSPAPPPAS